MQRVVEGLLGLASVARELGLARVAAEAEQAATQATQSRFNVAVLGQFKRGKSSVLNALIGKPLLPTDVLPTTGVVTVVSEGQEGVLGVTDTSGTFHYVPGERLSELITEEKNPHNQKGILKVTVPCSCSLTEAGVDLVDTPGLGSIFQHSATRTKEFLPRVDVALLVLGADPPITDQELELAAEAAQAASSLWVVLNKADLLAPEAQDRLLQFTSNALTSKLGVPFFGPWPVSAKKALEQGQDPGMDHLRQQLLRLAQEHRDVMAMASARRALKVLSAQALSYCRLEKHALTAPIDKLEADIAAFRKQAEHASDLALALLVRARKAFRLNTEKLEKLRQDHESSMLRAVRFLCLRLSVQAPATRRALDETLKDILPEPVNAGLTALAAAHVQEFQTAYTQYTQELAKTFRQVLEPVHTLAKELFHVAMSTPASPPPPPPVSFPTMEAVVPSLALDWGWINGLAFRLPLARLRAFVALRRGRELASEWWRRGCGELQTRFALLVDETVRRAEAAAEEQRLRLQQEILAILETARLAKNQGETHVACKLFASTR